jgi:WD40 repeat protein
MDSRYLAFCDDKGDHHDVDVWDLRDGAQPHTVATILSTSLQDRAFTPDGRYLLSTDIHRAIVTSELSTGKEVSRFVTEELSPEELVDAKQAKGAGDVPGLSLSPDGTKLAVSLVSRPGVDIWDPRTGRRLYSLPEENGAVWWMAWSADSAELAVSRSNGDISVWKLPEIEKVLAALGLKP